MINESTTLIDAEIFAEAKRRASKAPEDFEAIKDEVTFDMTGFHSYTRFKENLDIELSSNLINMQGVIKKCRTCGFGFNPEREQDRNDHRMFHKEWDRAVQELGYSPSQKEEREMALQKAYNDLSYAKQPEVPEFQARRMTLASAYAIMKAFYDKSLIATFGDKSWKKHPSFLEFTAHNYQIVDGNPRQKQWIRERFMCALITSK